MRVLLLAALLAVAGCAPLASQPRATGDRTRAAAAAGTSRAAEADLERRLHAEANAARRRAGRPELALRNDLARVARRHARDMAARDYFSHRSPDGQDPEDRALAAGIACRGPAANGGVRVGVLENLFRTWIALHVRVVRRGASVERIADERTPAELAREVVDGWLGSPGHRRSLLDPGARGHGLGVAIRPDSAIFVAQVLC